MMLARTVRAFEVAKHWMLSLAGIAMMIGVVFVVANAGIYLALRQFPAWAETAEERITREFNQRFETRQGTLMKRWLAIDSDADLDAFLVEARHRSLQKSVYDDFTQFRPTPGKGRFFNFEDAGYRQVRNQGPWPPSAQFYNIFFFGGSTTMGIGPDWATVPSYLEESLTRSPIDGKSVRVYNFGRAWYFSTQERILMQQLLLKRFIPDMVLFLDGLNDFYLLDGRPWNYDFFARAFGLGMTRPPGRTVLDAAMDRVRLLPMTRLTSIIQDKMFTTPDVPLPIYKPEQTARRDLDEVINRYVEHIRQVDGISHAYGIISLFVWQPIPGYKYDLRNHIALNPIYGLGGHERSAQGYPVAAERRTEFGPSLLWLADIQEDRAEALYMDAVHYNAEFAKVIADKIGAAIREQETRASTGQRRTLRR
jgi:hypothetical protein